MPGKPSAQLLHRLRAASNIRKNNELAEARKAYATLRLAICDIEGGMADTLQEARDIAAMAVRATPPSI